jgi:hypothetical protein
MSVLLVPIAVAKEKKPCVRSDFQVRNPDPIFSGFGIGKE